MPKSTTMHGPPNRWWAASVLTMRSAPTSFGLSVSSGTPVLVPGSTMTVGTSVAVAGEHRAHLAQHRRARCEHSAMPVTSGTSASRPRKVSAISSAVARASVLIRQECAQLVVRRTGRGRCWCCRRRWRAALGSALHGAQVGPDVEHGCGVGEGADREVVDAGGRDARGHVRGSGPRTPRAGSGRPRARTASRGLRRARSCRAGPGRRPASSTSASCSRESTSTSTGNPGESAADRLERLRPHPRPRRRGCP